MSGTIPVYIYISSLSAWIPAVVGIIAWRKLSDDLKIFLILFLIAGTVEILSLVLANLGVRNLLLGNLFIMFEFSFFVYVISMWKTGLRRKLLVGLIPVFLTVYVVLQLMYYSWQDINQLGKLLQLLILIIVALFSLYEDVILSLQSVVRNYKTWILLGMLLYFGGTAFSFLLGEAMFAGEMPHGWLVHSIINTIANVSYGASFLWARVEN